MPDEDTQGPGVKKYIDEAKKILEKEKKQFERVKKLKFDTIAVHGLYTVEEALERNQGAVIEPLYLATAQAYRDSDELEAALAYLPKPFEMREMARLVNRVLTRDAGGREVIRQQALRDLGLDS